MRQSTLDDHQDSLDYTDPDVLERLYHDEGLSLSDVGRLCDAHRVTVGEWMDRHSIEKRPKDGDRPIDERFWEKVDRGAPDECWEWKAFCKPDGYGFFTIGGDSKHAHRVAYTFEVEDPGDLNVLHKCDNPPCVNPNHLYAGDPSDNLNDAYERGRREVAGENNANAKLTADDVREIRRRLNSGDTQQEVADSFGITQAHVSEIKLRKKWSDI